MSFSNIKTPSGPTAPSSLVAVGSTLPALCIVAVILRFNVRRQQRTTPTADDWIMLPALTLVLGMGICGILGVKNEVWGYLTPTDLNDSSVAFEGKLLEAFQYIQIMALSFIKIGALAFYKRVFRIKSHRNAFDIARSITLAIIILWTIAMTLMNSLQCGTEIDALWTGSDQFLIYCSHVVPYEEAFAITNFLLDLWIILLPLPKIFGLQVTTPRKFAISGVFLLALVGLASSIARMVIYIQINTVLYDPTIDYRLVDTLQAYWSILEAGMGLLAVNLPALWFYTKKVSLESVIASIRSVISLHSLRSSSSGGSRSRRLRTTPLPTEGLSTYSESSNAMIIPVERNEVYAMHDVEAQLGASPVPKGAIMVNSTVYQGKE